MSEPRTIRWGILATGGIAITFAKDLLVDPNTRGVSTIKHTVVAAASSSSADRARDFLKEVGAPAEAQAYGSYEELVKDSNVDIIYIATPHSHHYQNALLCLEAGKNVLCEKAFTVNAQQARKLVEKAKEKNLFLMEAMWTRYFPLTDYVRETINSGKIGPVLRVFTDASVRLPEEMLLDDKNRMTNAELAGGALLDLGVYSLTWPFLALYRKDQPPPTVTALVNKHAKTGVDETTTMLINFPRDASAGGDAHAVSTTSIRVGPMQNDPVAHPSVRIQGQKGELQLYPVSQSPKKTKLILADGTVEEKDWPQPGPGKGSGWYNGFLHYMNPEGEGQGMFWEADDAAFSLIEGRKEGKHQDLTETVAIMEFMDEVRRQAGFKYPEALEKSD